MTALPGGLFCAKDAENIAKTTSNYAKTGRHLRKNNQLQPFSLRTIDKKTKVEYNMKCQSWCKNQILFR